MRFRSYELMNGIRYIRFATYAVFVAIFFTNKPRLNVLPAVLEPAPYKLRAQELVAGTQAAPFWSASDLKIAGGLPAGTEWQHSQRLDFTVWSATMGKDSTRVSVGIYVGMHPRVDPPAEGLEQGLVGEIPVLWWKHWTADYRTTWDALIPHPKMGYVHVWIESYAHERTAEVAEHLKTVRFTYEQP